MQKYVLIWLRNNIKQYSYVRRLMNYKLSKGIHVKMNCQLQVPPKFEYFLIDQVLPEKVSALVEQLKIYKSDPIEERLWMLSQGMETAISFAQWIIPRIESRTVQLIYYNSQTIPTLDELSIPKTLVNESDKEGFQPIIKVYLHSDELILVPIEVNYTIRNIIDQTCKILELDPIQQLFGLELVIFRDHDLIEDNLADENDKILDLLKKMQYLETSFNTLVHTKVEFRFNLRMKVMYRLFKEDLVGLKLYATQTFYQFKTNHFKLQLKEIIRISAINLSIVYGLSSDEASSITLPQLTQNLKQFFPFRLVENEKDTADFSQQDWAELIYKDYKAHVIPNYGLEGKHNSKMHLLNTLRPQMEFQAHQFNCSLTILKNCDTGYKSYPSESIIFLIRPLQIAFMDLRYRVIRLFELVNLSQWGIGANGIFLRCDGDEMFFLSNSYKLRVADNILNSIINWNMKKPISYRYCPEYDDMLSWGANGDDKQQITGSIDQKIYLTRKAQGSLKCNSANQPEEPVELDFAAQIKELQKELKKFDYSNLPSGNNQNNNAGKDKAATIQKQIEPSQQQPQKELTKKLEPRKEEPQLCQQSQKQPPQQQPPQQQPPTQPQIQQQQVPPDQMVLQQKQEKPLHIGQPLKQSPRQDQQPVQYEQFQEYSPNSQYNVYQYEQNNNFTYLNEYKYDNFNHDEDEPLL